MITVPPIVGVPIFSKWVCGPSSRIRCPHPHSRNRRIAIGVPSNVTERPPAAAIRICLTGAPPCGREAPPHVHERPPAAAIRYCPPGAPRGGRYPPPPQRLRHPLQPRHTRPLHEHD